MRLNNILKNQQLVFLITVLFLAFITLWVLGSLASPILLSIVLAFLFRPLHVYLMKIGVPKGISVFVTFLIAITLILVFFVIFIPLFINEANRYISEIPNLTFITEPLVSFLRQFNAPVPSIESTQTLLSDISGLATDAVSFSISRLQDTAGIILGIILVPIFLFFWLWDTDTLSKGFSKLVPKKRKFLTRVWAETNLNFQNYFKAKFIEVLVVAIFGSLMFWLLGVNSPVLLGVTFGLSQLIPFFGPVFMTFPVLIVSLAQFGLDPYVLVILFCYGMLQNIDGNIFLPFLMSGVVKLPAVVVLLSVFFFGAIFGIWGVFFSVPLASFIKSLLDNWKYADS
tara:strand:+ start:1205 stop:2227 length:1023 start_codon:yes stop_codon:yes gene_type:complete